MKKRVNKKYAIILFILAIVILFCLIIDKSDRTDIRKTDTSDVPEEAFSENAPVRETDAAVILDKGVSEEPYISPLDQTTITYKDGFYYYRSAVYYDYLYRCDENGANQECVTEQVPWELYAVGEWIYFTNWSQELRLCRIKTDGSGLEVVCDEEIIRFFPIGNVFYCLVREESGEDKVFSCTEDGEMQILYEGVCTWVSTDGKNLYLKAFMKDSEQSCTIVTDVDGNIKKEYDRYFEKMIPTEEYLYYSSEEYEKKNKRYRLEIVQLNQETGEEDRYEVPCVSEEWEEFNYNVKDGILYLLCYRRNEPLKYGIFQCKADTKLHTQRYAKGEISGWHTLYRKVERIHFLNGNCFFKMYVDDGKGSLWHIWDCSSEKPDIFEEMQASVLVDTSWDGGFLYDGYRNGYLEEDIIYEEKLDGDRGIRMDTKIVLPKISDAVSAAETINQKIKEDAEQFYAERLEFHNTVDDEWEEWTSCSFECDYAYADESYVSIIYRKIFHTTYDYVSREYIAKIYSSKTGEELQIEELFDADWEKVVERMTFLIQKTQPSYILFDEYTFSFENDYRRRYYCLNDFGIDILFVEDMRTFKEYHFVISYEELKDYLLPNLQITEESNSEKWNTEECQKIIHDKEEAFGCDFTFATSEFEEKIQGIWQVKEFVGWDDSSRYQWDGFYGDIMIFCEKAWIEDGTPWYQPVYACYETKMNELEDLLKITWSDNRYKDKEMILTIGVCAERNKKFSDRWDGENILFILLDDVIVMERNGSYWELEKVGDIEMSDALSNVSGI